MRPRAELVNLGATDAAPALSHSSVIRCLALVALLLLGVGCGKKKKIVSPTPSPSPEASPLPVGISAGKATWTIRKEGEPLLTLTTETAEAEPDVKGDLSARLVGQKATLFRKSRPFLELTGDVQADEQVSIVTVRNAHAKALQSGLRVSSDTITWNRTTGMIHGTGNVRAELDGTTLLGKKFVADERLTRIELDQ
jgi:hypothetical protein